MLPKPSCLSFVSVSFFRSLSTQPLNMTWGKLLALSTWDLLPHHALCFPAISRKRSSKDNQEQQGTMNHWAVSYETRNFHVAISGMVGFDVLTVPNFD